LFLHSRKGRAISPDTITKVIDRGGSGLWKASRSRRYISKLRFTAENRFNKLKLAAGGRERRIYAVGDGSGCAVGKQSNFHNMSTCSACAFARRTTRLGGATMRKLHFLLSIAIIAASAISPAAATTYTYTEGSASDVVPSFSFTTSLTGAALDNLAPNTDITSTITSPSILSLTGLFEPRGVPPQDLGNFPLGPGGFGGSYYNVVSGGAYPS